MAVVSIIEIVKPDIQIFDNDGALSVSLTKYIGDLLENFVKERGAFTVVASGGSLIKSLRNVCVFVSFVFCLTRNLNTRDDWSTFERALRFFTCYLTDLNLQGKDKIDEERRIAICIFYDVAEQCRESALKHGLGATDP